MPSILEQMYIAEADATKYQAVLEADRRMRQLMGALPGVVLRAQDPALESKASWIHTARRTLAISAADKVCIALPHALVSFSRLADAYLADHYDPSAIYTEELPIASVSIYPKNLRLGRNDNPSRA